jgi:hypothetical protein
MAASRMEYRTPGLNVGCPAIYREFSIPPKVDALNNAVNVSPLHLVQYASDVDWWETQGDRR